MMKTSNLFHTTILVLILAPGLLANAHYVLAQDQGTATTEGRTGVDPDHASDLILDLGSKVAFETTGHLSLPNDATAVGATVTVIPGPGANGTVHPDGPRVDVGADGTYEWAFDEVGYGEAGHQTEFGDGSSEVRFGQSKDGSWTITTNTHTGDTIVLPKNARVDSADLLLNPEFRDDWWNRSWLMRVPIDITAGKDGFLPMRIEREVRLDGNQRDPLKELRLTMVNGGVEVQHPFWVVSGSWSSPTIGFDVPETRPWGTWRFYLYYDNPTKPTREALPRPQVPIVTVFKDEPVPRGTGPLKSPMGLAQDKDGTLLVADLGNARVLSMDTVGNVKMTINDKCPYDVAVDGKGHIALADAEASQVLVFRYDGRIERTIGGITGSDNARLNRPWAVAFDAEGRIFISDNGNERVQVYESLNAASATWTYGHTNDYGQDSSHLDSPRGIAVSDGLYVADAYNSRVQYFPALNDRYAQKTLGINRLLTPTDVAVSEDRIFISDTTAGKVLELDRDGYYLGELTGLYWPGGLAIGPSKDLWISETAADRVLRIVDAKIVIGGQEALCAPNDIEILLGSVPVAKVDGALTGPVKVDLEEGLEPVLEQARCDQDVYGNGMCRLRLSVRGLAPSANSSFIINGLDIRYSFSTRMSVALAAGTTVEEGGRRTLPVKASSRNGGQILLRGFSPSLDRPPFLLPLGWEPHVPEETNGTAVVAMEELFSDEGWMAYEIGFADGPDGAEVWISDDGGLMADLSASPNSTRGIDIWLTATDSLGQSTMRAMNITVDDVPDAPSVPDHQLFMARCGEPFTGNVSAYDGDGDRIMFMLLAGPDGLTMDKFGTVRWVPWANGKYVVSFLAADGLFDVEASAAVQVSCVDHPPVVKILRENVMDIGELSVTPLEVCDKDGDEITVELRGAPKGMRYDPGRGVILWTPGRDDIGYHTVAVVASDGDLRTMVSVSFKVVGPRPWARISLEARRFVGGHAIFEGEAGDRVSRVEARVDEGPWVEIDGTTHWYADVDTRPLEPGIHRLEVRSFDDGYSGIVGADFNVPVSGGGPRTIAFWPGAPYLVVLIAIIFVIGGVFMLRSYGGFVFSVQQGPDGPTICVPVGTRSETAGHSISEEEPGDVPDQPPRNVRCYVCLGRLKRAEDYLECGNCGRVYHKACASRIRACPICGADLVKEEVRGES